MSHKKHSLKILPVMKLFTMLVRLWIITLAVLFAIVYVMNRPEYYLPLFIGIALTYGFTAIVEAYVVGLDTMRGKFILLLSTMGFTIALAFILEGLFGHFFHILFRLVILIAVGFMYLNLRMRLHIPLSNWKRMVAVVSGFVILIITFVLSSILNEPLYKEIILWLDAFSLILVVLNALMYLGGDIEKIWVAGLVAMVILLVGDVFFLFNFPRDVHIVLWFIPLFIMNNVALKVIEEG